MGRNWESPAGNLYASTLVRPRSGDPPVATLALVAAVALHEVASAHIDGVTLKWPNDLLVAGAKLSGILLERAGEAVAIGFGVNLAHHPEDLGRPATSIASQGGGAPDPALFVEDLAQAMARWLSRWRTEGLAPVRARWLEHAHGRGTALSVTQPDDSVLAGLFDGLDADGALILRLADGRSHVIHAGDVFLI